MVDMVECYKHHNNVQLSWKNRRRRSETRRMMSEATCSKLSGSLPCPVFLRLIAFYSGMESLWRKPKQRRPKKISRDRWPYNAEICVNWNKPRMFLVLWWMDENLSLLYQGLSDVATILARRVAVEFSDSDDGPSDSEYDSDDWGKDPKKYSPLICLLSRCEGTSPSLCPVLTFPLEGLN